MVNKVYNKKEIIILAIAIIVILVIIILNFKSEEKEAFIQTNNDLIQEDENKIEKVIIVHIVGCVKNPGIVEVKDGARIIDVIEKAGGITEDADISKVNLAYIVKDAQKIYVPSIYDDNNIEYINTRNGDNVITNGNGSEDKGMININTSTQTELEQLPGIGPTTALKIINYRKENGEFKSIEEIKEIPGIGDAKFETIKNMIEV